MLPPNNDCYISIDGNIGTIAHTKYDFIYNVNQEIGNLLQKPYHWFYKRSITAPRNGSAFEINNIILAKFLIDCMDYRSVNSVINTEDALYYAPEFLNSINPVCFPRLHNLDLKQGVSIILLQNLDLPRLCSGTRCKF